MDAIRFEPTIGADFLIDRRQGGGAGDLFADMLGEQLKKRSESERPEPAIRRRNPVERRSDADAPATQGRPIRPVVKHPHTVRGESKPAEDGQKAIEARKDDDAVATNCAEDQPNLTTEKTGEGDDQAKQTDQAEPEAKAATDGAVVQAAVVQTQADSDLPAPKVEAEGEAAPAAPAAAAASSEAAPEHPEQNAGAAQDAAPNVADFAAALAASQAETAAALTTDGGVAPEEIAPQVLNNVDLAALAGVATQSAPAAAAASEPAAESAELVVKLTPDAPRSTEPAKPHPSARPVAAAEIKAQQTVPAQVQQAAATIQPAAQQATSAGAESTAAAFDTAIDGDGATVPGWALHLAQGAASKRPDFIAQLRQHLQDLPAHEQVAVHIQRAIREGTGRLSIQLSPSELGQIHVKLEIDEEKHVTAAVTVEKPSTLELLQRDVKALERALHNAGLQMDGSDLSFSLGRQDSQEFAQDLKQSGPSVRGQEQADGAADLAPATASAVDTAAGLVNVEV